MVLPIPVIPIVVAAALGAGAATAVLNWDKIKKALSGTEIAVLGPRQVGKSTFLTFLRTGEVDDRYEQSTVENFNISRKIFSVKNQHKTDTIEVDLAEGVDVAGSKDYYQTWQNLVKSADLILYFFNADLVKRGDEKHRKRIKEDAGQIERWLDGRNDDFEVYVIGTHCDLNDDFQVIEKDESREYDLDGFSIDPVLKEVRNRLTTKSIILGSLKTEDGARGLVSRLFVDFSQ